MWLLDKNVPIQLVHLLSSFGVDAVTAEAKGWGGLRNGELVATAVADGISCILTRDRLFAESAARPLKLNPGVSVVLLTLTQSRTSVFLKAFESVWLSSPIRTKDGVVRWPG
jgi:predicted nuclease of predicted toxin-antitoxin system